LSHLAGQRGQDLLDLLELETVLEEGLAGLGALRAVRVVLRRTEDERPDAVRVDPEELLLLGVRERELDGEVLARPALGDLARDVGLLDALDDEDVAQDDAADVVRGALGDVPGADDVDLVALLEDAREELMLVAGQLDGSEVARQRCPSRPRSGSEAG
jgi:hypothetical protein